MEELKDLHGDLLSTGDKVHFTTYGDEYIRDGFIKKITSKSIIIEGASGWGARVPHHYSNKRIIKIRR